MNHLMEHLKSQWKRINSYEPLSSGVEGAVYHINANKKFVVKILTDRGAFDMEKYVGSIPGIERSGGVRVHAHTTVRYRTRCYYALILDHASFGHKDVAFTMPAKDYLRRIRHNNDKLDAFHRLFAFKLKAFYRAVRGFHGDLHDQNVVVTLDKSRNLFNIVILDYGRFVPFFLNNHNHNDLDIDLDLDLDLKTVLDKGHRTFENVTRNLHFTYLGVPRRAYKRTGTRNPSASNRNMLQSQRYWKGAYYRLVPSRNTIDCLNKRTVLQLKQLLRDRNLKVSGNKSALCARLHFLS
jgi:hypothetical protein